MRNLLLPQNKEKTSRFVRQLFFVILFTSLSHCELYRLVKVVIEGFSIPKLKNRKENQILNSEKFKSIMRLLTH